jgi:hypothetical protein
MSIFWRSTNDSMRSRTHQVRSRLIGWVNIRPSQACNACTTAHIYCNARSRRFSATSNQNVTAWYIAGQLFRSHTSDALNRCTYTWIIYQSRLRRVRCNCKQAGNAQLKYMTWGLSLMINPPRNDMTRLDLDNQTRSLEVSTVNYTILMLLIIPRFLQQQPGCWLIHLSISRSRWDANLTSSIHKIWWRSWGSLYHLRVFFEITQYNADAHSIIFSLQTLLLLLYECLTRTIFFSLVIWLRANCMWRIMPFTIYSSSFQFIKRLKYAIILIYIHSYEAHQMLHLDTSNAPKEKYSDIQK